RQEAPPVAQLQAPLIREPLDALGGDARAGVVLAGPRQRGARVVHPDHVRTGKHLGEMAARVTDTAPEVEDADWGEGGRQVRAQVADPAADEEVTVLPREARALLQESVVLARAPEG